MLKNRLNIVSLQITIVISLTLFTFRPIFSGKIFGEPFDTRLQIILHEHWWRWLNGSVEFRNTEFFYPYDKALGFSDLFLTQGLIHSIFRFLNFSLLNSWVYTTLLLLILGNLGWIFVAQKFIRNGSVQVLFICTCVTSFSFVQYFIFNPNIVGYTFFSWFTLLYYQIVNETDKKKKQNRIWRIITLFQVYALSCWYGAFFLIITIFVKSLLDIFLNSHIKIIKKVKLEYKYFIIYLPINLFLFWLFYYVYLTVSDVPYRTIAELIKNSPRLEFIFSGASSNGVGIEGSIFKKLYETLNLDSGMKSSNLVGDWGGGLGIALVIIATYLLARQLFRKKQLKKEISLPISIFLIYLSFVIFDENKSFFSYFFNLIPGLNSIRSPSRYIILVGFFLIFIVFYKFDKILDNSRSKLRPIIFVLMVILFLDQLRSPYKGWDESKMNNSDLNSFKEVLTVECDYFYYDRPGGWWYDQIESIVFASQIDLPTVNGYSGAFPKNYPVSAFESDVPSVSIFDWISKIDEDKVGCFVQDSGNFLKLKGKYDSQFKYGFTETESSKSSSWNWAVAPTASYLFLNNTKQQSKISFEIFPAKCFDQQFITISNDSNVIIFEGWISTNGRILNVNLDFTKSVAKRLDFKVISEACNLEGDPRDLYFELKNLSVSKI